jgi:hypothetical protein
VSGILPVTRKRPSTLNFVRLPLRRSTLVLCGGDLRPVFGAHGALLPDRKVNRRQA